jgi:hypothetical protein
MNMVFIDSNIMSDLYYKKSLLKSNKIQLKTNIKNTKKDYFK